MGGNNTTENNTRDKNPTAKIQRKLIQHGQKSNRNLYNMTKIQQQKSNIQKIQRDKKIQHAQNTAIKTVHQP